MNKERFIVVYEVDNKKDKIKEIAKEICFEQTVEVKEELAKDEWIRRNIIGRIEDISPISKRRYRITISFPEIITNYQIPLLLNILYGNISLKKNIKVVQIKLSHSFLSHFQGPKFGISGIRRILNVKDRPLLATAIKPMGKSNRELASFCYKLSLGEIDIIKDDHGLGNHPFSPFKERIRYCIEAIKNAQTKTRKKVLYFPNINNSYPNLLEDISWAKEQNIDGILISPLIIGFDLIRYLSTNLDLPIMAHPALMGTFFTPKKGISPEIFLGLFMRLIGADLVIYPNFNGRFSFTKRICLEINRYLKENLFSLKKSFPVLGGGVEIENITKLKKIFGKDIVFLVGSNLYLYSQDLTFNVKYFLEKIANKK